MNKSDLTRIRIEEALIRVLERRPENIPSTQKLSVKAVEEEAGLGSGSVYYYKDIVLKIKDCAVKNRSNSGSKNSIEEKITNLRERLHNEIRLKEKYFAQIEQLKKQLSNMASQHNQFALLIQQYQDRIIELEADNLVKIKKNTLIK